MRTFANSISWLLGITLFLCPLSHADFFSENLRVPTNGERIEFTRRQRASDLISNLCITQEETQQTTESNDLRRLIMERRDKYFEDLNCADIPDHPRKLLHYLAPKIPAIKHSPDSALRIQSARGDMDSGVAASLIAALAHSCELYEEKFCAFHEEEKRHKRARDTASEDILSDRRFEQLVECVMCGVDVKRRKKEYLALHEKKSEPTELEEMLDDDEAKIDEGLSIDDACRAAWGLAVLDAHKMNAIGEEKVTDILMALSLRVRELLLAKLQQLRTEDFFGEVNDDYKNGNTLEARVMAAAEMISRDTARAMWTFACVRSCTGLRTVPLFEVACSILCQDPMDLRKRAQENTGPDHGLLIGTNDIVDRLAMSDGTEKSKLCFDESRGLTEESFSSIAEEKIAKSQIIEPLSASEMDEVISDSALSEYLVGDFPLEVNSDAQAEPTDDSPRMDRRLNESPSEESSDTQAETPASEFSKVDIFIDWLAPNEVIDALWALAIHGRKDRSLANEEMTLSEVDLCRNAAVFSGIAVDRIIAWLDRQLKSIRNSPSEESSKCLKGDTINVKVVDAASLLATREIYPGKTVHMSNSFRAEDVDRTVISEKAGNIDVASNVISSDEPSAIARTKKSCEEEHIVNGESMNSIDFVGDCFKRTYFQLSDLCSLAWIVTEMRDDTRFEVIDLISDILIKSEVRGLDKLSGTDLSNLAWGLAKAQSESDKNNPCKNHSMRKILELIIEYVISDAKRDIDGLHTSSKRFMRRFQPPEITRLVWAAASTKAFKEDEHSRYALNVSLITLFCAEMHSDLFGTEDLARILWASVELNAFDSIEGRDWVANAFGKILMLIEASLLRWESGHGKKSTKTNNSGKESVRFITFFGRTRFNLPLLDQKNDESYEEKDHFYVPSFSQKHLPLLRELPIDPSTLCKLAYALARLKDRHHLLIDDKNLVRILIRLMISRNGRLLGECSIQDLARLCYAAAHMQSVTARELLGVFTRRVVQLLNDDQSTLRDCVRRAEPTERAILIWSLGELGVRHQPDADKSSAYKRLQIVTDDLFVPIGELGELPFQSVQNLIHGLVALHTTANSNGYIIDVLKHFSERNELITKQEEFCDILESLYDAISQINSIPEFPATDVLVKTNTSVSERDIETSEPENRPTNQTSYESPSVLIDLIGEILTKLSDDATLIVSQMDAHHLRRVLAVYASLPHQADELIQAIEDSIADRERNLKAVRHQGSLNHILARTLAMTGEILRKAQREDLGLQNEMLGKKAPFPKECDLSEKATNDTCNHAVRIEGIETLFESLVSVGHRVNVTEMSCVTSTDQLLSDVEQHSLLELGRCHELIQEYRRVDFRSGECKSRFDHEHRRSMSKRITSRLLP